MNINFDQNQINIDNQLSLLANKVNAKKSHNIFFNLFNKENSQTKGLYIYGGVGRGKTMLMQKFYHLINSENKIYYHFHEFMHEIHENLHEIRKNNEKYEDELIEVVKRITKNIKVICFDEFWVMDVADAMLLSRIFSYIFSQNIVVVFTSNSKPQDLYQNGLQREKFLEFVNNVLEKNCEILHLDSEIDYRKNFSNNLEKFYFLDHEKDKFLEIEQNITKNSKKSEKIIKNWGRNIKIDNYYEILSETSKYLSNIKNIKNSLKVAIFEFEELIKHNYSASDYLKISKEFNLIFINNLYSLPASDINEARRFVLFIDEIYENKCALIILANCNISEIYKNITNHNNISKGFLRSVSRLSEIESGFYFLNSKIII